MDRIVETIEIADGFVLILAVCNDAYTRDALVAQVERRLSPRKVETLRLGAATENLWEHLKNCALSDTVCVQILGLDAWLPAEGGADTPFIKNLNAARDQLGRGLGRPLIIWLPEHARWSLASGAPDLYSICSLVVYFAAESTLTQAQAVSRLSDDTSGSSATREELLQRVNKIESLLASFPPDSDSQTILVRARQRLELSNSYLALGRHSDAEAAARASLQEIDAFPTAAATAAIQALRIGALIMIGDLRLRLGDGDGARKAFDEALRIAQDLAARDPQNAQWKRNLSVSWNRIGDLRLPLGDWDGAREAFGAALHIAQELAARNPENAEWQRDLSLSWERLGELRLRLGDDGGAREAFDASLRIRQELASRDPQNAERERDLGVSWNKLGDLRLRLGDGDGARQAYDAALHIALGLVVRDPENAVWQRDLSITWERLGDLRLRLGDGDGARQAYDAALRIRKDLAAQDPQNAEWQRDLCVSWDKLGVLKLHFGDGDGAREAFDAALRIAQDLATRDPQNTEWRRDLAISHSRLGILHLSARRFAEAAEHLCESISGMEAVSEEFSRSDDFAPLAMEFLRLGAALASLGQEAESNAAVLRAANIAAGLRANGVALPEPLVELLKKMDATQSTRSTAPES